jgi:hypothetical protein
MTNAWHRSIHVAVADHLRQDRGRRGFRRHPAGRQHNLARPLGQGRDVAVHWERSAAPTMRSQATTALVCRLAMPASHCASALQQIADLCGFRETTRADTRRTVGLISKPSWRQVTHNVDERGSQWKASLTALQGGNGSTGEGHPVAARQPKQRGGGGGRHLPQQDGRTVGKRCRVTRRRARERQATTGSHGGCSAPHPPAMK